MEKVKVEKELLKEIKERINAIISEREWWCPVCQRYMPVTPALIDIDAEKRVVSARLYCRRCDQFLDILHFYM